MHHPTILPTRFMGRVLGVRSRNHLVDPKQNREGPFKATLPRLAMSKVAVNPGRLHEITSGFGFWNHILAILQLLSECCSECRSECWSEQIESPLSHVELVKIAKIINQSIPFATKNKDATVIRTQNKPNVKSKSYVSTLVSIRLEIAGREGILITTHECGWCIMEIYQLIACQPICQNSHHYKKSHPLCMVDKSDVFIGPSKFQA